MQRRIIRAVMAVALAVAAAACTQKVRASVNCEVVQGAAIECTVRETKGTADIEVCWEFKVTCDSGATLAAERTCTHVADGQTTKTTIGADKVKITGNCEGAKRGVLEKMTINGEASQP